MVCMECYKKQLEIDELKDELVRVKAKLRYQERTSKEGPFKSSTPSSKIPVKPNSLSERQSKKGGGRHGHKGHGRTSIADNEANSRELVEMERICPQCQAAMEYKGTQRRSVVDYEAGKVEFKQYRQEICRCPRCRKVLLPVLPEFFHIANTATVFFRTWP